MLCTDMALCASFPSLSLMGTIHTHLNGLVLLSSTMYTYCPLLEAHTRTVCITQVSLHRRYAYTGAMQHTVLCSLCSLCSPTVRCSRHMHSCLSPVSPIFIPCSLSRPCALIPRSRLHSSAVPSPFGIPSRVRDFSSRVLLHDFVF